MKKSTTGTWRNIFTKSKLNAKFYPNISEEKFSTEQSVKGNSQPNKLCIKVSSKQSPKETSRIFEKTCLPNIAWRRISTNKISEKKSLPRIFFKQFLYQNFLQKMMPRKLWRDILQTKTMHLYQKVSLETSAHQTKYEEKIPWKNAWRNIYQKYVETSPPKCVKRP